MPPPKALKETFYALQNELKNKSQFREDSFSFFALLTAACVQFKWPQMHIDMMHSVFTEEFVTIRFENDKESFVKCVKLAQEAAVFVNIPGEKSRQNITEFKMPFRTKEREEEASFADCMEDFERAANSVMQMLSTDRQVPFETRSLEDFGAIHRGYRQGGTSRMPPNRAPLGSADLDPMAAFGGRLGGGGGMLMGPDDPLFSGDYDDREPVPCPPGARFDPVHPYAPLGDPDAAADIMPPVGDPTQQPIFQHPFSQRSKRNASQSQSSPFGGGRGGFGQNPPPFH